jgi:hypothetical protein
MARSMIILRVNVRQQTIEPKMSFMTYKDKILTSPINAFFVTIFGKIAESSETNDELKVSPT